MIIHVKNKYLVNQTEGTCRILETDIWSILSGPSCLDCLQPFLGHFSKHNGGDFLCISMEKSQS